MRACAGRHQVRLVAILRLSPDDERRRLIETAGDDLDAISHFGFGGHARFDHGFRVLVAGGGTGDSTIYLAEQLRGTGAELVHLDLCSRSIGIARSRARARGLRNIEWRQASIESLADAEADGFDYINCCGVLHHLPDPDTGLRALARVLKPDGLMFLMVYGEAARAPVYQMQQLLRLLTPEHLPLSTRLEHTVRLLQALPDSNPLRQSFALWEHDIEDYGEAGLADLLLHPQDRAYSVTELHDLLLGQRLELVQFVGAGWMGPVGYDAGALIGDEVLGRQLEKVPAVDRMAIAELLHARQTRHQCYVAHRAATADTASPESVPLLCGALREHGRRLARRLSAGREETVSVEAGGLRIEVRIPPSPAHQLLFRYAGGRHSLAEAHALAREPVGSFDQFVVELAPVVADLVRAGLLVMSDRRHLGSACRPLAASA